MAAARDAKMRERKEKRKTDRRNAYFKAIDEKKKKEEDERRAKEDEEKRRKQNEQAEKQRKREQEIEEKLREREKEKEKQQQPEEKQSAPSSGTYRPKAAGGAGFAGRVDKPGNDTESNWRKPEQQSWGRDDRGLLEYFTIYFKKYFKLY